MSTFQFDEWENSDGEPIVTAANAAEVFGVS
mgnify:CR=1 FL=1